MAQLPLYSPTDLNHITDCTLKYSFFEQVDPLLTDNVTEDEYLETVVLKTIQHLHASGGPFRLNLPATLRTLERAIREYEVENNSAYVAARQMVATYHRQLKAEWPNVIASNERMELTIRLPRNALQVEDVIDRVDKMPDGGITGVKFILSTEPLPLQIPDSSIETTILHALIAAAYPGRRPVRLKYLFLFQNQTETIELTENQFRQNLAKMKSRVQAWLDGEILARPGPYCEACPFQYEGCPLFYQADQVSDI